MWCRLSRMSNTEETSIMVQGVTDEEKTFDDSSFGFVCLISLRSVGLDKRILKAVHDLGYAHPTLVQVCTWNWSADGLGTIDSSYSFRKGCISEGKNGIRKNYSICSSSGSETPLT